MMKRPQKRPVSSLFPGASFIVPGAAALRLLVGLIAGLAVQNCALFSPRPVPPAVDVTGFWEGRSNGACMARVPRCGAVVLISLSMIQNESEITGMYRCATGNAMCRNLNTQGRIAVGKIRGRGVSLRIMFEDVSSCIFNGTFSSDSGGENYICLQGGGIVERGYWKVQRAFGPSPPPAWWTG
jgi:hypothetical protein